MSIGPSYPYGPDETGLADTGELLDDEDRKRTEEDEDIAEWLWLAEQEQK